MDEIQDLTNMTVGFIGGGNMANAIGTGLIKKGVLNPKNVWVSARTEKTLKYWKDLGTHTTFKNGEVIEHCEIIFLAVKPHMLDEALLHTRKTLSQQIESRLFVSVVLGVSLDSLSEKLSNIVSKPRIIRSMPNTPMMVGEGITVYCSKDTNALDTTMVDKMFSSLGASESIPESLMIPVGSLSGCGPAFAYLIVESLADGAVKMGVPRAMATKFAAQVLVGAGKMVLETERHPGQLKDEVCSPGGATITGVHSMETGQVRNAMMNAVEAAANKAYEFNAKMK